MDHQYRENGVRTICSNYNQMRACVECSPDQSKIYTLSTFPSSSRRNFEDSRIVLAVSEYCSSALTVHAYKMVTTTVCVQIDNCFCNR